MLTNDVVSFKQTGPENLVRNINYILEAVFKMVMSTWIQLLEMSLLTSLLISEVMCFHLL